MGSMKSLLCLDVSENKIDSLPEELGGLLALADLLVSQNLIEALPESIGKLSHLLPRTFLAIFQLTQTSLEEISNDSFGVFVCRKTEETLHIESRPESASISSREHWQLWKPHWTCAHRKQDTGQFIVLCLKTSKKVWRWEIWGRSTYSSWNITMLPLKSNFISLFSSFYLSLTYQRPWLFQV